MAEFKVGDMVRRITEANEDSDGRVIKVGDVRTVKSLDSRGWLCFANFSGSSNPKFFVPVVRKFKVGDKVVRLAACQSGWAGMSWPHGDRVMTVTGLSYGHVVLDDDCTGGWMEEKFELVQVEPMVEHTSRANDPATGKAAGKVKRTSLREKVWVAMTATAYGGDGRTGHELAKVVGAPLNSVTPRLAELRRADKIKDSGQRRDKQIVWVLV
jgi:hypothetical protein